MLTIRRLCVVVLGGLLLVAGLSPALGADRAPTAPCGCQGTVSDHVSKANAVFTGRVSKNTRPQGNRRSGFSRTSTVTVQRVYKGEIARENVEVATGRSFGRCAVPLRKGRRYVFFVRANEGYTAGNCGGTDRATDKLVRQVERLLGDGRAAVPSESVGATLTPVTTADPTSLSRLAAPGLALVLIGLLGLALVRRLSR